MGSAGMKIWVRKAVLADVARLREVIEASVRGLQAGDYSPSQIESALKSIYGVDTKIISDGTYFVAEVTEPNRIAIAGCGGWSKRKTLFGGDQYAEREDSLLDPARDAAKIRAFFVHPEWARRGIGSLILEACENEARMAGFTRLEMGATLSGVAFYQARGYAALENLDVPLSSGEALPIVKMAKEFK
jgi:GNAT superfamily N-acetyltransferase